MWLWSTSVTELCVSRGYKRTDLSTCYVPGPVLGASYQLPTVEYRGPREVLASEGTRARSGN